MITKMASKKCLKKFSSAIKTKISHITNPYEKETDFLPYYNFFSEYSKKHFETFQKSLESFDPNMSDQLCHVRAIWYCDLLKKFKKKENFPNKELIALGEGMVLSRSVINEYNAFGMMDKCNDIKRSDFEEMMGGEEFSNKRKVKFHTNLKSVLSKHVNDYISETFISQEKSKLQDELLFHFSNKLYFTQKQERIPFVPFFSSGYVFLKAALKSDIKLVVLYRQFIIQNNEISLNGYQYIPVINNKLEPNYELPQDENVVVIEAYSCAFLDEDNKYSLKFYKNPNFNNTVDKMSKEINFTEVVLANFAYHDPYHQPPMMVLSKKPVPYDFFDLSNEHKELINSYKKMAEEMGAGLHQWFPFKNMYLKNDISFNLFHIYARNTNCFCKDIENGAKYLNKKYLLYRKFETQEIPLDIPLF